MHAQECCACTRMLCMLKESYVCARILTNNQLRTVMSIYKQLHKQLRAVTRDRDQGPGVHGPWSMLHGPWTMNHGPWTMDHGPWTMDYEPWTMDYGPWSMDYGLWTMDHAPWTMHGPGNRPGPTSPTTPHPRRPWPTQPGQNGRKPSRIAIGLLLDCCWIRCVIYPRWLLM